MRAARPSLNPFPLKLPFALKAGRLLHISDATPEDGGRYSCPGCLSPLVLRKGRLRRHHFAHLSGIGCGETALHHAAKLLIYEGISRALNENSDITLAWPCGQCDAAHNWPLLKKAVRVGMEEGLGGFRPDIALYGTNGEALAAIEVIVNHAPETAARQYYQAQRIGLIECRIETVDDLQRLRDMRVFHATAVDVCLTPKCGRCGGKFRTQRILYAIEVACPNSRCRRPMKVGFRQCGQMGYPRELNESEVALLKNRGVQFGSYSNRTFGTRNRTCVCLACGRAPSESQYRGDYWYKAADDKTTIVLEDEVCSKCFSAL